MIFIDMCTKEPPLLPRRVAAQLVPSRILRNDAAIHERTARIVVQSFANHGMVSSFGLTMMKSRLAWLFEKSDSVEILMNYYCQISLPD